MTGSEDKVPPGKGGGAAERLRQMLAARFGHDAPPVPPDEPHSGSEEEPEQEQEASPAEPGDEAAR